MDGTLSSNPVKGDGLGDGPREPVKDVATSAGVILLEALTDVFDHDVIAHQATSFDDLIGHLA